MKIKKGDTVQIIAGRDNGKQGKVLKIHPALGRVLVDGINMIKKHQRPKKQGEKGEIISVSRPIQISNVMIVCNSCSKPARIGYKKNEEDIKMRYCKRCKNNI